MSYLLTFAKNNILQRSYLFNYLWFYTPEKALKPLF